MLHLRNLFVAIPVLASLAATVAAGELEGIYQCQGTNPDGRGTYQGAVAIMKNGDAYNLTWTIGTQSYVGTGLKQDDTLAVAYSDAGKAFFGIVAYKIEGNSLSGRWAAQGSGRLGKETLTKK